MNLSGPIRLVLVLLAATFAACSRAPEPATPATSTPAPAAARAAKHASLIELEAAFATAARERGVKAAFLEFLGEDAIVLQPGPVWGRAAWTVKKEDSSKLEWVPDRAQLAQSGDFGFTTGPWRLTPADPAAGKAEGRYLTVWQQTAGGWRVLFDGGFGRELSGFWDRRTDRPALGAHACVPGESMPPGELQILDLGMSGIPGGESHANRVGWRLAPAAELFHPPSAEGALDEAARNAALAALPATLQYWPMGAALAASGDLGYSYGLTAPTPGASANAAYVHVWCRQPDGWRVVLQLRSDFPTG